MMNVTRGTVLLLLVMSLACGCLDQSTYGTAGDEGGAQDPRGGGSSGGGGGAGDPSPSESPNPSPSPSPSLAPSPSENPTDCSVVTCKYVTPTGAGSKDGSSWSNAMASFPKNGNDEVTTLVRGATYFVASGTYAAGWVFKNAVQGQEWITIKKAIDNTRCAQLGRDEGDCHGTDTGWSDALGAGETVFTGAIYFARDYYIIDGAVRNEASWNQPGSYGIRLTYGVISSDAAFGPTDIGSNLVFRYMDVGGAYSNTYPGASQVRYGFQFTAYSAAAIANLRVSRCYIHNIGVAVFGARTDGVVVEHSHIGPSFSKEAIIGHVPSVNWTIRNNHFVDSCQGIPGQADADACTATIASWANNNTSVSGSDNWSIYGNLIVRTALSRQVGHSDGIILGGSPLTSGTKARNWKVYNNVVADLTANASGNYMFSVSGTGGMVANNLVYNLGAGATARCSAETCQKNWCSSALCGNLDLSANENPFVDADAMDFTIKAGSSAKDAGAALGAGFDVLDPLGATRGADQSWDVGAYEL